LVLVVTTAFATHNVFAGDGDLGYELVRPGIGSLRQAIKDSCPAEFKQKVFRDLFQDRSLGNSWPHENVYEGFLSRSLEYFFIGHSNSRVDSCLESVAAYCEAGGVYKNTSDYILRLELVGAETMRFFRKKSVANLAKACPVKLTGRLAHFRSITDEMNRNEFLENVQAVQLTLEKFPQLDVAKLKKVTDLHLIVKEEYTLEHYEEIRRMINMANLKSIKFSVVVDLYATGTMITGPPLLLADAKNLERFELSYRASESMETLIDAFPSNLKRILFQTQDLRAEELNSLNDFLNRSSTTLESLALPSSFRYSNYPTLPKTLKSLTLLDSFDGIKFKLLNQLREMTSLEKLDARGSLFNYNFYSYVPNTVKKLEIRDNSPGFNFRQLGHLLKQIDSLSLRHMFMSNLELFLEVVFEHKNIKHLAFKDCHIPSYDFIIKQDSAIETLVIENSENHVVMQDEKFLMLQDTLNKMPRLEKFSMIRYKTNANWNLMPRIIGSLVEKQDLKLLDIYQVCLFNNGKYASMFDRELEQLSRARKDMMIVGH
jgi:hypothetical protein